MNPVAMHDQCLAFIKGDALVSEIDGAVSYEILAKEFEFYWRQRIVKDLKELELDKGISGDWYGGQAAIKRAAIAIAMGPKW